MRFMLILLAMFFIANCTDEPTTLRVLRQQGYTNIQLTGYRYFNGCAESDDFTTGFRATHPISGQEVTGVVCSTWYSKGATVRFD